jgi:hypothetical protein
VCCRRTDSQVRAGLGTAPVAALALRCCKHKPQAPAVDDLRKAAVSSLWNMRRACSKYSFAVCTGHSGG